MHRVADLIGAPFRDGGRGPDAYDCWGLVREVYKRYGVELPDYQGCCYDFVRFYEGFLEERPRWVRHEPPDIPIPAVAAIRFNAPVVNHVGVYVCEGKFLHTREKTGVVLEDIRSPAWRHRLEGFYSWPLRSRS